MSLIIPYKEKELINNEGAFIKPSGEIVFTAGNHEAYAHDYCCGSRYSSNNSTKLTKEQQELFEQWLDRYEFSKRNLYSDFMVYLLSFDKIEIVMREAITTTSLNPHIRFFNYYLMDWNIFEQPPMKYNCDTGLFEYDRNKSYLGNSEDKAAENEICEIKAKVLKKDRPLFFR